MSVDLDKLPRWIDKTTSCLYCSKGADLYDVYLDGEKVQTWYSCNNIDCDSIRLLGHKAVQGITFTGPVVELYKTATEA